MNGRLLVVLPALQRENIPVKEGKFLNQKKIKQKKLM